jgi:hypothetical protein
VNGYDVIAIYLGTEFIYRILAAVLRHRATQAAATRKAGTTDASH